MRCIRTPKHNTTKGIGMKFCTNCGTGLKHTVRYCLTCGIEIMDEQPKQPQPSSAWQKLRTKQGYILLSLVVLCAVIGHLVLSTLADPEKKIRSFEQVLQKKDADALYELLVKEPDIQSTPEQLLRFLSSEDIPASIDDLLNTAERVAKTKTDELWGSSQFASGDLLVLKHTKLLFYNSVDIAPLLVETEISLPKDAAITVAGKEYSASKEQLVKVGTFIPGDYPISYDAQFTILPVQGEGTFTVPSSMGKKQSVKLEEIIEGETVKLRSDYDGLLYINGKSTNQYVSQIESLSPVSFNEKLKLKIVAKDENGNELHSNELPLTSNELVFEFPGVKERKKSQWNIHTLKDQIDAVWSQLQEDYQKVLKTIDFFTP